MARFSSPAKPCGWPGRRVGTIYRVHLEQGWPSSQLLVGLCLVDPSLAAPLLLIELQSRGRIAQMAFRSRLGRVGVACGDRLVDCLMLLLHLVGQAFVAGGVGARSANEVAHAALE